MSTLKEVMDTRLAPYAKLASPTITTPTLTSPTLSGEITIGSLKVASGAIYRNAGGGQICIYGGKNHEGSSSSSSSDSWLCIVGREWGDVAAQGRAYIQTRHPNGNSICLTLNPYDYKAHIDGKEIACVDSWGANEDDVWIRFTNGIQICAQSKNLGTLSAGATTSWGLTWLKPFANYNPNVSVCRVGGYSTVQCYGPETITLTYISGFHYCQKQVTSTRMEVIAWGTWK